MNINFKVLKSQYCLFYFLIIKHQHKSVQFTFKINLNIVQVLNEGTTILLVAETIVHVQIM